MSANASKEDRAAKRDRVRMIATGAIFYGVSVSVAVVSGLYFQQHGFTSAKAILAGTLSGGVAAIAIYFVWVGVVLLGQWCRRTQKRERGKSSQPPPDATP